MPSFSHYTESLGLDIDTHLRPSMRIIYPPSKQADLLHKVSQHVWTCGTRTAVKILAVILGNIRHASQVVPCGEFISFFLQECLNVPVKRFGTRKAWSKYRQVYINSSTAFALNLLKKSLLQCESLHIWSRPIGLLVKRDPTFVQITDASTKGLGGVCFDALNFQWRCSSSLFALDRDPETYETFEEHDPNPHINILEFIAIIIHVYFAILKMKEKSIQKSYLAPNGFILSCLADNTSALSWMCHASRSRYMPIRNLAQFFITMLFHANSFFPLDCQGDHILGLENIHSDALSRPQMCPSYNDIFNKFECMRNIPRYDHGRATQAYCDSKLLSLASTDAGAVREGNEKTSCTASEFFQKFCRSQNFDDLGFLHTPPVDSERILVCFTMEVAEGNLSASGNKVGIKSVKITSAKLLNLLF